MSAQETTAPDSSGIKPGTIVRVAAILLGIASATLLAHSAFGIRFNEDFLLLLDVARDAIGFIVLPFELLIVDPAVRWLHEQGWVFQLYPHWKHVFVLLWLLFAAEKHALASLSLLFGSAGTREAALAALRWAWAAVAALVGSALAGTETLDSPTMLWWAVTGYFLNKAGDDLISASTANVAVGVLGLVFTVLFAGLALGWVQPIAVAGQPPLFWWAVAAHFAHISGVIPVMLAHGRRPFGFTLLCPVFAVASGALALGVVSGPAWLDFSSSPSPGVANLAAFVVLLAAWYAVWAVPKPDEGEGGYLNRLFDDGRMRIALDVFAVLGGAAIIVYGAHLMA